MRSNSELYFNSQQWRSVRERLAALEKAQAALFHGDDDPTVTLPEDEPEQDMNRELRGLPIDDDEDLPFEQLNPRDADQ